MLWELIEAARTKSSRSARQWGYVHETIAMAARFSRVRQHWEAHLKRSREFIERHALDTTEGRDVVVILGSGWTLDVPMAFLERHFREVILVDMVHPTSVRKRVSRKSGHVRLIEADLSGVVAGLSSNAERLRQVLLNPTFPTLPRASLIISTNLLSQLALPIVRHAEKRGVTDTWWMGRALLLKHAEWLRDLSTPLCVVTDYKSLAYDRTGACVEEKDLLANLALPNVLDEWTWEIAPRGEISRDCRYEHLVKAFCVQRGDMLFVET